jgi:adenylosuccinate lyase
MPLNPLTAISPLDGRYSAQLDGLRPYFSESGLIRYRVRIEIEWLIALAAEQALAEIGPFSESTIGFLRELAGGFGERDGERVKAIEAGPTTMSRRSSTGSRNAQALRRVRIMPR